MPTKYSLPVILICVFFSSCKEEESKLPLPLEKIEAILTDIHLADAAMQYVAEEKLDSLKSIYYPQVFEIHQISDSSFFELVEYLKKNPKQSAKVYQNMMDHLEKNKNDATSKIKIKKKREWSQDSLSRE